MLSLSKYDVRNCRVLRGDRSLSREKNGEKSKHFLITDILTFQLLFALFFLGMFFSEYFPKQHLWQIEPTTVNRQQKECQHLTIHVPIFQKSARK